MQCMKNTKGFTLVEVLIATMVLTIGLTGVAAMQINALNGTFAANAQSSSSSVALAWEEWLLGLMKNPMQTTETYFGDINMQHPENFVWLTSLDKDPTDTLDAYDYDKMNVFNPNASQAKDPKPFVQVVMPSSTDKLVDWFNGDTAFATADGRSMKLRFRKLGSNAITDPDVFVPFEKMDMPPPAPPGSVMVWRVAANVPVQNTATVEISIIFTNAFTRNKGVTLRFLVGAEMWGG